MAPVAGNKRKVDYSAPGTPAQARKRQKGKDARAIPTQTVDAALSKTGELNIASFVKAREFEIAALQQSMKKARKSSTQRAFQQVPRHMRRRTASHNVKKIPRRLRARALRDIKEDNTPTGSARKKKASSKLRLRLETAKKLQKLNARRKSVRQKKKEAKTNAKETDPERHKDIVRVPRIKKNKLVTPPQATSKFKRRQINKTWLPTHLWHTKRAHLTRPTLPLWRMAIPLMPTEKSYRPTHRAAGARGCVAWDTSYVSTIGCQGTEATLEAMLKALGFDGEGWSGPKYRRWKNGTRHLESWVFERGSKDKPIAPATVLWQVETKVSQEVNGVRQPMLNADDASKSQPKRTKLDRRLFIRVHASAFKQLWVEVLAAAKVQRPQVLLEDLRFEIGSIVVQGPQSTEALAGVLRLSNGQANVADLWSTISAISNPAVLPLNVIVPMNLVDPRLNHPPKGIDIHRNDHALNKMNETIVSWSLDKTAQPSTLFNHKVRYSVSKSLPSQKAINRRKAALLPSQSIEVNDKDPQIPAILLAQRCPRQESNAQGSWTILLPWGCVDLVWRSLMYCPLSSGSTPRFGGLEQTQQVAFEQCIPWFPGDFPGTESGKAWDRTESENRFDRWVRRPPSKRIAWDTVDLGLGRQGELGRGWACDWEYLFQNTTPVIRAESNARVTVTSNNTSESAQTPMLTQRQRKAVAGKAKEAEREVRRRNSSSSESDEERQEVHNDVSFGQLTPSQASATTNAYRTCQLPVEPSLLIVRLRLLTRGTPSPAARIYRLPAIEQLVEGANDGTMSARQQNAGTGPSGSVPALSHLPLAKPISATSLRSHWVDLDSGQAEHVNPRSSTALPMHQGAEKTNRYDDPVIHTAYDSKYTRDLSRIRVFPPRETKPEVLNMFGPRPPKRTEEQLRNILQPKAVPRMTVNSDGELVPEELWDKHVPCPGPENLIGYVTSGGYNLTEGRGTAIGSLWVQKLVDGWKLEDQSSSTGNEVGALGTSDDQAHTAQQAQSNKKTRVRAKTLEEQVPGKTEKKHDQRVKRERHLCVVRNAGESIGRLALWELC